MTSLNFSNVGAIDFLDYLAVFGKLKTSAPPQKSFDFSNKNSNPSLVVTSSQNYEKMKLYYKYYPKSNRDLSIYSFDGIRYCKITAESIKSLNGVIMTHETPKLLSEIVFPKIEYDSDIETDIYITLDHYNIVQTLNSDSIKDRLLNQDFEQFNTNLFEFRKLYPKANFNFLITNKQTYLNKYFEALNKFADLSFFKLIMTDTNTICNYMFESIVGSVVCGHIPLFNGFLLHDSTIYDPIYANTYNEKSVDDLKDDLVGQNDKSINLTMRSTSIQIRGNGDSNFLIIYKKMSVNSIQTSTETPFKIIEQLTGSELLSSETLSNCLFQNVLTKNYIEQLIKLIEFKTLIQTVEINDKEKCKDFYVKNIEIITDLLFFGIQNFDKNQSVSINEHICESSYHLLISIKQKINEINNYYIINQSLDYQFLGKYDLSNESFINRLRSCN